ncbi:hypothetical protein [Cedecea davisae]|uniref:hypothetical protein n=1 Tax=Cedecea davisae TaxID=158484 RepID=UPI001D0B0A0E|nr:hypothetical protein [Cedecea davisae]
MKKLTIPESVSSIDINIESTVNAILNYCTRDGISELSSLRNEWLSELNNYVTEMNNSKRLRSRRNYSFTKNKKILVWLYENPLERRKTLYIKQIRDAYIEKGITCPYCGIGSSTTLDHYYCKTSLPQFAILKENLIPCCGECNKSKGTLKPKKKWQRIYNPYFDDFESKLNAPAIVIHFKKKDNNTLFTLTPNPLLSRKDRMHVNFHLSQLQIKKKHAESINSHFTNESNLLIIQKQLVDEGELTQNGFDNFIRRRLAQHDSGGYDWSKIIFYSLVSFEDNHWCFN